MARISRAVARRAKLILQKAGSSILECALRENREFRRIWPTIDSIEGLLVSPVQERWLFKAASSLPDGAVIVEIGSFKGRSTCCLAYGCRGTSKHVFAIDTFEGNETDFFRRGFYEEFQRNIERCGLCAQVTAVRARSSDAVKSWHRPIHLLFVDGSHQFEDVVADFYGFFPYVVPGGVVAIHDVTETWPGPLRAWNDVIRHQLDSTGACSTLAHGRKPR